jgi:hypothetical protein
MRIEKKHGDKLAALFVSVDEGKGKALAYAGGSCLRAALGGGGGCCFFTCGGYDATQVQQVQP